MLSQPVKPMSRITHEQAVQLFAHPEQFDAAFNRRTGQRMATLWNGVKLFTGLGGDERDGERRIFWLQGSGATPGWDVEQVLEALNAGKTGLVMS